jgi:hypothetical protein
VSDIRYSVPLIQVTVAGSTPLREIFLITAGGIFTISPSVVVKVMWFIGKRAGRTPPKNYKDLQTFLLWLLMDKVAPPPHCGGKGRRGGQGR